MNIKEIIKTLKDLEVYCYVNKATKTTLKKSIDFFGEMPKDMQEFYKTYNGGLIFGYNFSSTKKDDKYYGFEVLNDEQFKEMNHVPERIIVFADTSYGDVLGYDKIDKVIVQINPENNEERWIKWNTFTGFLEEFLEESKKLIDEGVLEPLKKSL